MGFWKFPHCRLTKAQVRLYKAQAGKNIHCSYTQYMDVTDVRQSFDLYQQTHYVETTSNIYISTGESLNEPLHLRCGSYLHDQIDFSHTHIRAI